MLADHDVLTEVFATLRLRSALYFRAELQGDFAIALPAERRHVRFHLVRRGRCWLTLPGAEPALVEAGDLAIVPDGAAQVLSATAGLAPVPLPQLLAAGAVQDGTLRHGSGDPLALLLCGFCRFDEAIAHPLLASLPALMVLRRRALGALPADTAALDLLALEADLDAQGANGILARLLEVIFMQAVRRMPPAGYLAALADPQLARALAAIHQQPESAWTITALARRAGMSRARFALRFTAVVGATPIGYLTTWRLMKARALLATSTLDMAEIASRCGYASVPSFTRRFKQAVGIGPGAYRRSSRSE
jgi:AraC family transcriptional regulator, alkane utilization regulator